MNNVVKSGLVLLIIAAFVLTGCAFGKGADNESKNASAPLKVMANGINFYEEFGMLFSAKYPNIEIELIDMNGIQSILSEHDQDYEKAMEVFIEAEQPDVIVFDPNMIKPFIESGALYELDSLLTEENYNVDGLVPGVIETMREIGEGKIYSIPASFDTKVLFYNKNLFDQYNIAYPTDQMTWQDIITLAKQFPTEDNNNERLYGLNMAWTQDLGEIIFELSLAEGLNFFDDNTLTMTFNTPAWASLIERAVSISTSEQMYFDDMRSSSSFVDEYGEGLSKLELFHKGKIAMMLEQNYYIDNLIELEKSISTDQEKINWDIVSSPVSDHRPDSSGYISFRDLLSINAKSHNIDAAKTFISFITSDDYARVMSKLKYGDNLIRKSFFTKYDSFNYPAFYKLKPLNNFVSYHKVPQRFSVEFFPKLQQTLANVSQGHMTIEQALAELQLIGDELLATDMMSEEEFNQYLQEYEGILPGTRIE